MSETPRIDHLTANVGKDILAAVVEELKQQQKGFALCNESQQEQLIRRIDQRIRQAVRAGFEVMVAGDLPSAIATLEEVKFNAKGCAGKLALAATSESRHDLSDYAGRPVVVVLASSDDYLKRMDEIRGEKDQKQLSIDDADDTSGFNKDRHDNPGGSSPTTDDDEPSTTGGSDGEGLEDEKPTDGSDPYPGEFTRATVIDALDVIGIEIDIDTADTWDQATRKAVLDWAYAVHLNESDPNVSVPDRPEVIEDDEEGND